MFWEVAQRILTQVQLKNQYTLFYNIILHQAIQIMQKNTTCVDWAGLASLWHIVWIFIIKISYHHNT